MEKQEIFERFQRICAEELGLDETDITMSSLMEADLMADSLDDASLMMACEKEFDIALDWEAEYDPHTLTVATCVDHLYETIKRTTHTGTAPLHGYTKH